MKFPIRQAFHRHRLDRKYLESKRSTMAECPTCGRRDSLNFEIDAMCNIDIYCKYRIKCDSCGFRQPGWYEDIADAIYMYNLDAK